MDRRRTCAGTRRTPAAPPSTSVNRPEAFHKAFATFGAADTASLIAAAADVALLLDSEGVIRDVSVGSTELADLRHGDWIGRPWTETVTIESRPKVEALLTERTIGPASQRWRQVNHPSPRGSDVPMLYSAIHAGPAGEVVAIGRDMRPLATIQQRLVSAQQSMERDYLRLRQLETRYRALFQSVSEAVLIADASTLKIVDANPAAARVLDESVRKLVGRALPDCFAPDSRAALQGLLDAARAARSADDLRLVVAGSGAEASVSASIFRQDSTTLLLLRIAPPAGIDGARQPTQRAVLASVERAPDAIVVTDPAGRVLYANDSFASLAQMDSAEQVVGEPLDRWLGRAGVDLGVLIATLRQNDAVRLFPTMMRGRFGGETTVEISAAAVPGERPCLAFSIRDVGRRLPAEGRSTAGLQRTVGQLAELVGRVPLKDIVGETTDLIEQLCIEAALQLTRDNRAAAAEMLGLSRQSLYVKLRRYGLGDYAVDGAGDR